MSGEASLKSDEVENVQREQGIWRTYDDVIDGLSFGIFCPLQDHMGYLWLGSVAGLHRFDGAEFTSYTTDDGLVDNNIKALCEDYLGKLWIGTEGGVSCFDGERFINYTVNDGLAGDQTQAIYEDSKRLLWFGSEGALSYLDEGRFKNCAISDGLINSQIVTICEDRKGLLWFGTRGNGIFCFDGRYFRNYTADEGLPSNFVRDIQEDHLGRLWISTRNGISCFDGRHFSNYTTSDGLASNDVRGLCRDHLERLWFSTWNGVSCFDGKRFINYTTEHGLLDNRVNGATQDREGILWFSHPFSGLACFDPQTLKPLTTEPVTEALIQDIHGRLWYSNENTLCCLSEDSQVCRTLGFEIFGLIGDSRGRLWVPALDNGLYCYDSADDVWTDKQRQCAMKDSLSGKLVLSLLETSDGTIWAGTARPGCLCRLDGDMFETIPTPHDAILRLFEDSQGRIWIGSGTDKSGVSCYDGQNLVTFTMEDGLPHNSIQSIVEDDTGRMWFGTQYHLCCFDGRGFTTYGREQGLFSPTHHCSAKDAFGQLWFGTLRGGIYRTDGEHFQMLTTEDGLPSNSVTGLVPQSDGSMIVGTYRGIMHYRPTATVPPQIEIREVIANRVYPRPTNLKLTTTEATLLTISYHGLSFATRRMRYSYILEGYDEEWRDTWDKQIRYENLPVGGYIFKVIAINRDLVRSEEPAMLRLTVVPDEWSQLRAEYEAEIRRMRKLLEIDLCANSQDTLSETARAIVEGLRELGFDRAAVWVRDPSRDRLRSLWGTDNDGNIYRSEDEFHPFDSIPPIDGYVVVMDSFVLKAKLGVNRSEIYLTKDRDEGIFESLWGYPPPCPGYYERSERGDNIALCLIVEDEKVGILAVDNYITNRTIDETSANLLSLVGTETAQALANVALRESLSQSEAENRAILDAIPDLMFRISRDGVFLDYKANRDSDLYVPPEQITGSSARSILPSEIADLTIQHACKALDSGVIQFYEYQLPMPHGIRNYEARLVVSGENEVLAIVRDITKRKQAEERIKTSLKEKEVLLKEIHHRVKNNLQVISSMLNLQSGHIQNEQDLQIFKESQSRVRSMALIHEKLYQSGDLAKIDFAGYIRDLANYLFRVYGASSHGIMLETGVDDVSLDIDRAIPCGLIINELLSNSLKYGFPERKPHDKQAGYRGEIRVNLRSEDDGKLTLTVSDNGVGLPEDLDFQKTESLGLQLVNTLADQLEGTIELDRKGGTTYRITFAQPI